MNRSSFIPATTQRAQRHRATDESAIKCRRGDFSRLTAATSRYALLCLRLGTLFLCVLFLVVLGHFPSLVRVVLVDALERLQCVGPEILLINDSIGANNERLHSGHTIFSGRGGEGESANNRPPNP